MRDHFRQIYDHRAPDYQRLVAREDVRGALLPMLHARCPLVGARVVETGAGTGRLTRLLAPLVDKILALDAAVSMLAVAEDASRRLGHAHVAFARAEHRALPVADGVADLGIEGWAFGHLMDEEDGLAAVDAAIGELERVARPGATIAIIETLGTGCERPTPPSPALSALFAHLESQGFERSWCRTDYRFVSRAEAEELVSFFFGVEMLGQLGPGPQPELPECTGLWTRSRG